ncbi:small mechanosensitive channel family protein [Thraustotheca clavata]|uniref:Small mechanosensitive channel family protein n=1 Tax=Thraustotheca clavata TaxID=74557 RepID=A0A1V9ZCS6_9STRA|nr:small mechanosensitive channel family protein [Thraustotheca clavata]
MTDMSLIWRAGGSVLIVSGAYYFRERWVQQGFRLLRKRFGPKILLKDLENQFLAPVSWSIVLLALYIADIILQLDHNEELGIAFRYAAGIPLVVATIALRRVITKASIRYFGWDEESREDYSRVLMVTEGIGSIAMILIMIECFYIYVPNSTIMQELLLVFFTLLEIVGILACYTSVRNAIMGFFLIFAEPFSTGSLCSIGTLTGTVEQMALNITVLRAINGALIYIPNSILATDYQRNFTNCSYRQVRVQFNVHPSTSVAELNLLMEELREQLATCIIPSDLFQQCDSREVNRSSSIIRAQANVSEMSNGSGATALLESMAGLAELGSKCNSFQVHDLRCLQVTLSGMHQVLVTALVEGNDMKTIAKAKCKVICSDDDQETTRL